MFLEQGLDICFVTETWMKLSDIAKMAEIHERGLELFNNPRKGTGGGVGFLFNPKNCRLIRNDTSKYSSFEVLEALLETSEATLRLCVLYRSTQHTSRSNYNATKQAKFFEDFDDYLDCIQSKTGQPLICGDFNFHVENPQDPVANQFKTLIADRGYEQHSNFPTHISGGCLDLVLTRDSDEDSIKINNL